MRKFTIAAAFAFAALMTGWAPAAGACPGARVSAGAQPSASASAAVICLINHRRTHRGLRRLHGSIALWSSAQLHADTMVSQDFFSHEGPDGTPATRAVAAGYMRGARDWRIGENLGYGAGSAGSPRALVDAWTRSAEHRRVMFERFWRAVGVGATEGSPLGPDGPGMTTYSVDFGFRRG